MRPAFTKALYYPSIDIKNSDWLKTAVLFWDSISTIVPESIKNPYHYRDSEYLADIGFLQPIFVNSNDKSVVDIEDEIINVMHTPNFLSLLFKPQNVHNKNGIFNEKISYRLRDLFSNGIYGEKLSWIIRDKLKELGNSFQCDGKYYFGDSFSYLYMVTLANKICENHSIAMITDEMQSANYANLLRFDNQAPSPLLFGRFHFHKEKENGLHNEYHCKQGLLLDLIINGLCISPNTSLPDIIDFKEKHKDELGLFRTQLAKLTQNVSSDNSLDQVHREIHDLYTDQFLPAYNNFKKALSDSRIKLFTDSFFKISLFSTGTTLPMLVLGSDLPQALLAGAGVSMLALNVSYNVEKRKKLRDNPYSYLLATEREFRME